VCSKPFGTRIFTAAAAELWMTQAAVSYQVKLLEERLACCRSGDKKRVVLTEAGRRCPRSLRIRRATTARSPARAGGRVATDR
jgi:LysR family glycine cleavage system transcriptional activator